MAAIKIFLDNRYDTDHHPIVIRIAHGNKRKYIPTGFKIEEKYWDGKRVVKHKDASIINSRISDIISQAERYFAECHTSGKPINLNMLGTGPKGASFNDYLLHRAKQYDKKEMIVMGRKTRRIEKDLKECFNGEIYFSELTQDNLREYEAYLISQQNVDNTRHKKFKFLQQFYSQAVTDGRAEEPNPFKLYKINTKPVQKEKLTEQEIKAIEELSLQPGPVNDARNLFLFSYYCKGQRFETCITFKRDQIKNGRLHFKSNKGNKFISVLIHDRLKKILNQYKGKGFVFPYVTEIPDKKKDYIKMIDVANVNVNRNLKVVAGLAEIKPFTFHVARHSFAYHLKKIASSIGVISDSLGHSSSRTTEIYLKALDDEFLDTELKKLYGD